MIPPADPTPLRQRVGTLLIVVAFAMVAGRILAVRRVYEPSLSRPDPVQMTGAVLAPLAASDPLQAAALAAVGQHTWRCTVADEERGIWPARRPRPMPTLGANDRSRWDTVRALVDQGTYAIGYRDTDPATGLFRDRGIVTEDGWQTIDKVLHPQQRGQTQAYYSSKPPLLATLVAGEYWLLKHVLGWSITEQRWEVVRVILFTVNGLPLLVYLVLLARVVERFGRTEWGCLYVLTAGCFATYLTPFAITLNNHSVAACSALFALYPVLTIWYDGSRSAWRFALAGFFAGFTACNELPATSFAVALAVLLLWRAPWRTLLFFVPAALIPAAALLETNYLAIGQLAPAYSEVGSSWYEYKGSYWEEVPGKKKQGIDWASEKESRAVYAFHVLLGHHGFFSLTPIFLLAGAGMIGGLCLRGKTTRAGPAPELDMVSALTLAITLIVLCFYILVAPSRNYGGWTSGLRWLIWLTPLWLVGLLPAADWLANRRWGRSLAYLCVALSIVSVNYPPWNPWRHPWLYDFMEARGWIHY